MGLIHYTYTYSYTQTTCCFSFILLGFRPTYFFPELSMDILFARTFAPAQLKCNLFGSALSSTSQVEHGILSFKIRMTCAINSECLEKRILSKVNEYICLRAVSMLVMGIEISRQQHLFYFCVYRFFFTNALFPFLSNNFFLHI